MPLIYRSTPSDKSEAGFTLIEALVTLIIASVLSLLILQSVRSAASNAVRIERTAQAAASSFIAQGALRRTIENTRAYYRDTPYAFRGDSAGFTGLTVAPMDGPLGEFQWYSVRLQARNDGLELVYEDADSALLVGYWPEADGEIEYYGADTISALDSQILTRLDPGEATLTWRETWPGQARAPGGYSDPLPAVVRIKIRSNEELISTIIVHMPSNAPPPPRIQDVIGGLEP